MSDITINIEPFRPQPGDILIAKLTERLSMDQMLRVRDLLAERFPDHPAVVVEPGIELHAIPADSLYRPQVTP
jgi:hypothetical protein